MHPRVSRGLAAIVVVLLAACGGSHPPDTVDDGGPGGPGAPGGGDRASPEGSVFLSAVPPGNNGNSAGGVGAPVGSVLSYPDNFADQLELYGNLAYAQEDLKAAPCEPPVDIDAHEPVSDQACNYYKDAGLEPQQVTESLTLNTSAGGVVTIRRDGWGVPFVEGDTRADAMYGFGYASAQDRLWLHDALRAIGRGRFSEFLGAAPDTLGFDADLANFAGYSEEELEAMVERARSKFGSLGDLVVQDVDNMVAGINAYLDTLNGAGAGDIPPEYATLALQVGDLPSVPPAFPPRDWTRTDIVASATLIQSIFAIGGGGEHQNLRLLQALDGSFGPDSGAVPAAACELWRDLRHAMDPYAHKTVNAREFATQSPASVSEACPQDLPAGAAIFDPGSFETRPSLLTAAASGGETLGAVVGNVLGGVGGDAISSLPLLPNLPLAEDLLDCFIDGSTALETCLMLGAEGQGGAATRIARIDPPMRDGRQRSSQSRLLNGGIEPGESARQHLAAAGLPLPETMSNGVVVPASETREGAPIAVFGPQASYFAPQLLWEVAIKSGGDNPGPLDFNGRGVVFGDLPYINIGRGADFAWSATSGNSDLVDVRVSKLCNVDGTPATRETDEQGMLVADGYLVDAGDGQGMQCRELFKRVDEWTALPTVASVALGGPPAPQRVVRSVARTHYGPVFATATVRGEPVALSLQRATFFGELETAPTFALATSNIVEDFDSFRKLFNSVTGSFNWMYVDSQDAGVFHSGLYPKRDPAHHPELPVWGDGRFEWQGQLDSASVPFNAGFFDAFGGKASEGGISFPNPATPVAQNDPLRDGYFEFDGYLSMEEHPQVLNQPFIAQWNNAPADGWWASDANGSYGPTHRIDLLVERLEAFRAAGRKHDIGTLTEILADAAFVDLRGQTVLPLLLDLMQTGELSETQQQVVALMGDWIADGSRSWIDGGEGLGAYRRDRDNDGAYDHRAAVVLMDAWYQRLIDTMLPQFEGLPTVLQGRYDAPRAQGSAFQSGWYEHMKRLLETALDKPGHTPYRALRCAGSEDAGACRQAVLSALDAALTDLGGIAAMDSWDGSQLDSYAKGGDCGTVEECDAVEHVPLTFLPVPAIHWTNRPTFQQVIQIREAR
ncbi:penicillin acylase family protein [Algiphilus aromaticivorans]|uniref:penicillin acylase family protein n=1 Tax=Algiphilus aromaticivorans TaxID=382454 RepID=UPI0005C2427F|nr:penicillin acylase family protein [Algiphilus aromaticivorans]